MRKKLFSFTMVLALLFTFFVTAVAWAAEFEIVSYTAYVSLHWLKEAGVPEAKTFAKAIGPKALLSKDNVPNYEVLAPVNHFSHEIRYAAINKYVEEHNYKNVLDIACGFSPRGIAMAHQGKHFVGAEFEAVAVAADRAVKKCLTADEQKLVEYAVVDATDKASMMAAADTMQGPICITMDGLMMYLTADEQAKVLQNVRAVLKKHGGCFVTSDFSLRDIVTETAAAVYGPQNSKTEKIYRESAQVYESTAESDYAKSFFATSEEAEKFVVTQGLKMERVPFFSEPIKLRSTQKFNREQRERADALQKKDFLWVITAK